MAWQKLTSLVYRLHRRFPLPPWLYWTAVRLTQPSFAVGVTGLIQDLSGRVLLFEHTYQHHPWAPPGGFMKHGESAPETLVREVAEETGYSVSPRGVILIATHVHMPLVEVVVRADLVGGAFRPSTEVSAAGWYLLDDLPDMAEPRLKLLCNAVRVPPGETQSYVIES